METRAAAIGLASPVKIILDAMATATSAVLRYEKESSAKLETAKANAPKLLTSTRPDFRLRSNVASPLAGPSTAAVGDDEGEIVYDDDLCKACRPGDLGRCGEGGPTEG
jgi:hypothetical protein